MPVLDPSGFQIAIKIVTPDHQSFPLWFSPTGAGDTGGATVDPSLGSFGDQILAGLPCVESVDIDITNGLNSQLTVNIGLPFEIGVDVLRSALLRIGNVIECQVGYPRIGRFLPWISALAIRPEVRISPDEGLTATINGQGGAFIALRGSRTAVYENLSYADILRQILNEEVYEGRITLSLPDRLDDADDPLYLTRESVSQSAQSDWFFIQYIVRSSNCDAWMEPSQEQSGLQVLRVERRADIFGRSPRYVFMMRGNPDFDVSFPILDFETQAEGVWLPGSSTSVRTIEVNPDTLEVIEVVSDRATTSIPATADAAPDPNAGGAVEDTSTHLAHPVGDTSAGDTLYVSARDPRGVATVAEVHLTESLARGAGVQVTITTIGIPDLLPGEIIAIQGMGMFDAFYAVQKVTHRVSAEEWSMTLELLNNATTSTMLAQTLAFTPPVVNDSPVPEPTGDAVGGGTTEVEPVEEG